MKITELKPGELDVLDGSPPCQSFSMAGKRQLDDPRNSLAMEFIRLLQGLKPKVFVMENVSGLVKGKMKLVFAEIMKELKVSDYQVKCQLMNTMYFNVPQSRQRLIFVGVDKNLNFKPSHPLAKNKPFTVNDAIANNEFEKNAPNSLRLKSLAPYIKQGQDARYVPVEVLNDVYPQLLNKIKRHSFENRVRRAIASKPHPVIPKMFVMCSAECYLHPYENRYFSSGEIKRLSSYPDDFKFFGKYEKIVARIGNSVPPLFMKAIAEHIKTEILTKVDMTSGEPELVNS